MPHKIKADLFEEGRTFFDKFFNYFWRLQQLRQISVIKIYKKSTSEIRLSTKIYVLNLIGMRVDTFISL